MEGVAAPLRKGEGCCQHWAWRFRRRYPGVPPVRTGGLPPVLNGEVTNGVQSSVYQRYYFRAFIGAEMFQPVQKKKEEEERERGSATGVEQRACRPNVMGNFGHTRHLEGKCFPADSC